MKYKNIDIAGTEYPVSFGMLSLAQFLDSIGLTVGQLDQLNDHMTLTATLQLVHTGLVDGARKAGKVYGNTFEETCDLIDEAGFDAVEAVLAVFAESLPVEKKATAKARAVKKAS